MILALIAIVLKLLGVGFLFAAAVGVLRFGDPFQRMHAATKAGTLGAGLVILGVIVGMARLDVAIIGLVTVVFLLLTIPIAGHLLGRAAYVSGASLEGLKGADDLQGVLFRQEAPLEARLVGEPHLEAVAEEEPAAVQGAPAHLYKADREA